ncbi:MAG: family 10 glycosylhydrolase, partial [Proteiniphilum sp.]|nr:family 10 glycosylhydrolase [Proteiniphilum sp.]MDD4415588.1 family 10 glycosylhydrolase [Proteiniphilum sp.]
AGIKGPDPMGEKRKEWIDWRASHLKELFREVNRIVKKKNPKLLLTAASGVGPQQYCGIYRDSRDLLSENIVDYIFPMNYTDRLDILKDILEEQVLYTPGGMSERIFPGLKLYTRKNGTTVPMDAEIVDQQLKMVKQYGYRGFCLFAYSYFSDEMIDVIQRYSQ